MDTKMKSINLLPKEYIMAQKASFYQKIIGAVVVVEVVGFVLGVALPPKREVSATQDELLTLTAELNSPKYAGVNKTLSDLENAKADIQKWITEYSKVKTDDQISRSLLDALTTRVPVGVNIVNLEISDELNQETGNQMTNVHFIGQAVTEDQILNYINVLETIYLPKDIVKEYSYNKELACYDFEITIKSEVIKQVAEEAPQDTQETDPSTEASETGEEEN